MTELRSYEVRKRWLILLTGIFHGIGILFFCFVPFESFIENTYKPFSEAPIIFTPSAPPPQPSLDQPQPQPLQEPEPDPLRQAALKPRASVFGVTDEEQETPEFTPGITDSASINETSLITDEHDQALTCQEKTDQGDTDQPDTAQSHKVAVPEAPSEQKETTTFSQEVVPAQDVKGKEESPAPTAPQTEEKKPNQASRHNTGSGKKNASPIKRTPSFADLARGFLECSRNEGQDWLTRDGDETIRPGIEELRYLSYMQKVYWHLQNTIKQYTIVPEKYWPPYLEVRLLLKFDRQGTIADVMLIKKSGHDDYDHYCMNIFKDNNCDYPRIPSHIKQEHITLPLSLVLSLEKPRIRFMYNAP